MPSGVTYCRSIIPAPTVDAAVKLNAATHRTACTGVRTFVATTVAIEFAASWNPLTKSKISATRIMPPTRINVESMRGLVVLYLDVLQRVGDVFAIVRSLLQELVDLLKFDDANRVLLVLEQIGYCCTYELVSGFLQPVYFD